MLRLLHKCTRPGYPPEYLLSRITARMQRLNSPSPGRIPEESSFQASDAVIWEAAADERRWLYLQMDTSLRRAVAPLFFYFEIDTLVLWIRTLDMDEPEKMTVPFDKSLLSGDLKKIFRSLTTPAEAVTALERWLKGSPLALSGLVSGYREGGVQRCEEMVREGFFDQVPDLCVHPEVTDFFRTLIDQQNIMSLAKCLRWKKQEVPRLFKGGHSIVRKSDKNTSEAVVKKLVRRGAGGLEVGSEELHPARLEPLLRNQLSRTIARRMREGDPVVGCLGYVWHVFAASRNRSARYHAARFEESFPAGSGTEQ